MPKLAEILLAAIVVVLAVTCAWREYQLRQPIEPESRVWVRVAPTDNKKPRQRTPPGPERGDNGR